MTAIVFSARIQPKLSKLEMSLRHTPPLLCNEKYIILCHIQNTELSPLTDLWYVTFLNANFHWANRI